MIPNKPTDVNARQIVKRVADDMTEGDGTLTRVRLYAAIGLCAGGTKALAWAAKTLSPVGPEEFLTRLSHEIMREQMEQSISHGFSVSGGDGPSHDTPDDCRGCGTNSGDSDE